MIEKQSKVESLKWIIKSFCRFIGGWRLGDRLWLVVWIIVRSLFNESQEFTMALMTSADLRHLLDSPAAETCVSLYMNTHMTWPDSEQNPIVFKNLVKELEQILAEQMKGRDFRPILAEFQKFQTEDEFWKTRTPALAMYYHAGHLHRFDLPRAVPDGIHVAESFHLKPIFRILQTTDRFNILALDRRQAQLFEASRDGIIPLALSDIPDNPKIHDNGARSRVGEQHFSAYGGAVMTIHDVDEKESDAEFFAEIDDFVAAQLTHRNHLPLVLAALSEHQGTFRKVSHNKRLLSEGVVASPHHLPLRELRDQAFAVVEKSQHAAVRDLINQVEAARAHGKGSTDLAEVAKAAVAGRVHAIIVDADQTIGGRLSAEGDILKADQSHPEVDDLLDDIMESVFKSDGEIFVLPSGIMPLDSGIAALFRY